jgi:hypothetical protein
MLVSAATQVAAASPGYLPMVGPPAIKVRAENPPAKIPLPPLAPPVEVKTNSKPVVESVSPAKDGKNSAGTNQVNAVSNGLPANYNPPLVGPPAPPGELTGTSTNASPAGTNALTAQGLAGQYYERYGMTNQLNLLMNRNLRFLPPIPTPLPPVPVMPPSSSATYLSPSTNAHE